MHHYFDPCCRAISMPCPASIFLFLSSAADTIAIAGRVVFALEFDRVALTPCTSFAV